MTKKLRRKESIWELRERLGIKPEDLAVDIDTSDYEKVVKKELEEKIKNIHLASIDSSSSLERA